MILLSSYKYICVTIVVAFFTTALFFFTTPIQKMTAVSQNQMQTIYFSVGIPGFKPPAPGAGIGVNIKDQEEINKLIRKLLTALFKIAFSLAAIFTTVVIAFYGVRLLALTAGGHVKGREEALTVLKNGLLSLVILIGSYIILNTVNPDLVSLKFLNFIIQ